MSELPSTQRLEQLFSHDPEGLRALREIAVTPRVSTVDTPVGPVVAVDGRKLHSGRDPVREARRFVRNIDLGESTVVILLGFGSGHVARAIGHQTNALLVIFEPDLEALRVGLEHGPLPPQTQIITDPTRLGTTLYRLLSASDRGQVLVWKPSARQFPSEHREAARQARLAIERARFRDLTTQVRVQGWLDFFLRNMPRLTQGPGLDKLRGAMRDVPAVICAAGPSLNKNVALLRGLEDRVLILTVNTAAAAVAAAGVKPHAVVSVESLDIAHQLEKLPWISDAAAFLELTGNPALFDLPFRRLLPISVDTSACSRFTARLGGGHDFSGGFCVANTATALAQALGCRPLILIGQDLAYAGDRVYADGTVFQDLRVDFGEGVSEFRNDASKREIEARSSGSLRAGIRQANTFRTDTIPAWGGGPDVVTASDFLLFRDWYAHSSATLRRHEIRPINATEGGAHIEGWDEIPLSQVIREYGLDQPAAPGQGVTERFKAATNADGIDHEDLIAAVEAERSVILSLIRLGLQARALVGDDPDGDITANTETSMRLAEISNEVSTLLRRGPLCTEALTVPLDILRDRQELNTVSMHQAFEQHLSKLDEGLEEVLERLRSSATNPSVSESA